MVAANTVLALPVGLVQGVIAGCEFGPAFRAA
jgi:hypothetical protein